jgi:hypothetical protein
MTYIETIWNYALHCLYGFFRMRISPVPLTNLILNSKLPLRHLYIQGMVLSVQLTYELSIQYISSIVKWVA